ncbi:serine hydrolase [Paenibacillus tyrfis]|uniref:serine hydrolase n=1 Tax=Paenibacillus tyrfis TaxID=1501230 RepID=UPI00209F6811|nr:serine hydrolase [Paenibacillus tyrfis]MCP1305686.1 serine hydrolase [Paenibacillus tyrfis]
MTFTVKALLRTTKLPAVLSAALLVSFTASAASAVSVSPDDAPAQGPSDAKEVEAFADSFFNRADLGVPGAAIVIVKDGKVLLQKGYGFVDVEKKQTVDPDRTVFRIGSVSKAFTATAVMQLVEQGEIDLDRDVQTYMDGLRIDSRFQEPVTMKHLLTHTTGFDFTEPKPGDISPDLDRYVPLKDYIAENMPTVVRKPGESYNYDNFASMLQGYIVQNVSGIPFHQYMDEQLFKPLGMKDSGFLLTPDIRSKLATDYGPDGKPLPLYAVSPTELPQGGMFATVSDVAKFMITHLNNGAYGGNRILQEATAADMHSIHLAIHPKVPQMAYGFETSNKKSYNGRKVIGKGGNIGGFSSWMWLMPEQNVGGFIVSNKRTELHVQWFNAFMNHYYPKPAEPDVYLQPTQAELARFEGLYSELRTKTSLTQVTAAPDGKLIVEAPGAGKQELRQIDDRLFKDADGNLLVFQENADKSIGYLQYRYEVSTSKKLNVPKPFSDVRKEDGYAPYIATLQLLNLVKGKADGTFGPSEPITRGEFAAQTAGLLFMTLSKKPAVFADTQNHPAAAAIQTLHELGVIQGSSQSAFEPDKPITRQEAAVIVARTIQLGGASPMDAKLSGHTDPWALDGVKQIVALGLYGPEVKEAADGSVDYKAQQPMLRQEAAALFAKALSS